MPITVVIQGMQQLVSDVHALVAEAKTANQRLREIATANQQIADAQERIADTLDLLIPKPGPAVRLLITLYKGGIAMSDHLELLDDDPPFTGSATPLDAEDQPTTLDPGTAIQWSVQDDTVASELVVSDDSLSFTATPGSPGASTISASYTNARGELLEGQASITVRPGTPAKITIDLQPGTTA